MRSTIITLLAVTAALTLAAPAQADSVEISVECHWYVGVDCELQCDELDFEAYCDVHCDEFEISAECEASCTADCEVDCEGNPGSFDCEGYCGGECGAYCEGECEASDNAAACQGECGAYCDGECSVSCEAEPPEFSCEGSCDASCEGHCSAEANIDCHICTVDATIDCDASCDVDGILECNGEFIGDFSLEDAVDWVLENTNFDVTYEGEADCQGNECHATGSCSLECAVGASPGEDRSPLFWALLMLAAAAIPLLRRR